MKNFEMLYEQVKAHPVRRVAVAVAQDAAVIRAVVQARADSVAESILVGDEAQIHQTAESAGVSLEGFRIEHQGDPVAAVAAAVKLVSAGEADILMKGYIHTDDFLRGVLHRQYGLRTGSIMSHVFIAEAPWTEKLLFVTDAAMNIAPGLEQKAAILLNAVYAARLFGVADPKVAVMAAVELVNPNMPATLDAAALATMADRNQYAPHCTVDGPFALDNAINPRAAAVKRLRGPVAGQADILLVPNIEAGNMLAKSLVYFAGRRMIGLLLGAAAPVVVTSRADTAECKLLSIAGAVLMVNRKRELKLKVGKVHC